MVEIRKFIRKKCNVEEGFSRGFLYYCLNTSGQCTIDKIMEVVLEIKRDFPNVKEEQIAIKSFETDELVLYFYSMEIPIDMYFEEFRK